MTTQRRPPFGWIQDPWAVDEVLGAIRHPVFHLAASPLRSSGAGQVTLLHQAVERVRGTFPVWMQTVGDCVSQGWALAVTVVQAVQVAIDGLDHRWAGDIATEPIYAGSRVEVGGGRLGRRDGSIGAWAGRFVQEWGAVVRDRYGDHDLSQYDGARARRWGMPRSGVPDELEPRLRKHPVRTISLISSYEEARDAIHNGYPVPVGSLQGFQARRDDEGFAAPKGRWPHLMCFVSVDDLGQGCARRRPGLLCCNSWGAHWIDGPTRHGQPDGSFWVDAEVADDMLRQGDAFAVSGFEGYPKQTINHLLF